MILSYYFCLILVGFVGLFFFLLVLQILFWKIGCLRVFGGVFSTYKFVLLRIVLLLEIFFISLGDLSLNLFLEINLWFNITPYVNVDFLSSIFFVCAARVSWCIMQFRLDYITDDPKVGNFLFFLLIFLLLIFILVFSRNFLLLFVRWEGVRLMSFMLISWWGGRQEASTRALQAVYYNRVGDARLLIFLVLSIGLRNRVWVCNRFMASSFFFLFLLRVVSKSSQLAFHPWLPNAIEGPTPVSSLLHSSTIVMARVFLLMRSLDFFEYHRLIFYIRLFTCILRGVLGLNHGDFKKVVAYSTTSQLGFIMMVLRVRWGNLCLLYIIIHASFKAIIFIISRVVIHMSRGIQDFRHMPRSLNLNNLIFFFYFLRGFVIIRFPFLSRFWIKDIILEGVVGSYLGGLTWCFFCVSVLLTGLYSVRLYLGAFLWNLVSQFKLMLLRSLRAFPPFIRLVGRSVLFRGFVYVFCGPFPHFLLSKGAKLFALRVLGGGVCFSLVMREFLKGFSHLLSRYLLFFNPLWHKVFSFVRYWYSRLTRLSDFLLMEFFFYRSVKYIWEIRVTFRFYLLFVILLLFYFF